MNRSRAQVRAQPGAGEGIRERLLAGVPVRERRLLLAGHQTAVLEGGVGRDAERIADHIARAVKTLSPDRG